MPSTTTDLEKRLWDAADDLRANSKLKSSEHAMPALGLIFLRYADFKFAQVEGELSKQRTRREADEPARTATEAWVMSKMTMSRLMIKYRG
jgi:type I restriction-modification system DNA methylase subunit